MANIGKSLDRRRFLKYFAMGAAAAPIAAASRSLWAGGAAPAAGSLCYGNKRILTASDLNWLGAFKVPTELCVNGVDPQGTLAARRVNGEISFFMQAAQRDGAAVFEFRFPGLSKDLDAAPRAAVARAWGDVYGGRRIGLSGGPVANILDTQLFWDDTTNALYWLYVDSYNVSGVNNPVVGCATLNDISGTSQTFGPWQTGLGPHQSQRVMLRIPAEFAAAYLGGQSLALGDIGTSSGNSSSSWGPVLGALRGNIGPGVAPFPGRATIPVTKLVGYSLQNRAHRDTDYVPHGSPDEPGGVWTQMDGSSGTGCWIETSTCTGMVFFQMRATGHIWYGVSQDCGHGLADVANPGTTGPHCTSSKPMAYVYDPQDFVRVIQGHAQSYEISATEIDMTSKGLWTTQYQRTNGSWFDPITNQLFVSCMSVDAKAPWLVFPIVNVYQVTS